MAQSKCSVQHVRTDDAARLLCGVVVLGFLGIYIEEIRKSLLLYIELAVPKSG